MAEQPVADERISVPAVVSVLSAVLQRQAERNDAASDGRRAPSAFQGVRKPSISVRRYLERIFRYACCSPSCYVVAYIYLDRFAGSRQAVALDSFNVHRLLITSVLTAVKFMDDIYYNNAYYAKVGGISLMEMNYLEVDFLFGIGFELNVTPVTFSYYCSVLQKEMCTESIPPPPPPPPPPLPPAAAAASRSLCCLTEEEPSSCRQKQLAV
ncbi:cyclin-P4-1-like [Zingiber officinale]|nr:cyclin-P4-1-like [Zingiber officinale]